MSDRKKFAWLPGIFLAAYFLPLGNPKVTSSVTEAFRLLQWYAINHTLACTVASVSGVVLAVCSCSVLPMFAGIYKAGAGLGPASAFLYSGPAINVMAVFLSARVLGTDLGVARAVGSISFAFAIGLVMALLFRRDEAERTKAAMQLPEAA